MAIQIAESDLREERGRLYFREQLWPWQVIEFDGKFPALDAFVHVFEPSASCAVVERQPLTFLVQHKSKIVHQGNPAPTSLTGIEIEHVDYWLSLPVPVMLTMFRQFDDRRDLLFRWVNDELRLGRQAGAKTMTVPFEPTSTLTSQSQRDMLDYLRRRLAVPQMQQAPLPDTTRALRETIVLRAGLDLVFFCSAGFSSADAWTRFRFDPDFFGESAVVLHAQGGEDVGVNVHHHASAGLAEVRFCAPMSTGLNMRFEVIPIRSRDGTTYDEIPGSVGVNLSQSTTWQTVQIPFDFRHLDDLRLIVLAPRINERVREQGPGLLAVHSVTVTRT